MDFGVEVGQERIIGNLIGLGGNNEGFGFSGNNEGFGPRLENVEIGNEQQTISLAKFIIWPKKIIQIKTNMTDIISQIDIVQEIKHNGSKTFIRSVSIQFFSLWTGSIKLKA